MKKLLKLVSNALSHDPNSVCHCGLCGQVFRPEARLDFFCYHCKKRTGIFVVDSFLPA